MMPANQLFLYSTIPPSKPRNKFQLRYQLNTFTIQRAEEMSPHAKVTTVFVSEKVSKVRWLPEHLKEVDSFLTGSWDMNKNFVRIWRIHENEYAQDYCEYKSKCSDKIEFNGDISGLEFIDGEHAAVACTDGHISIIKVHRAVEEDTLEITARSTLLHKIKADERAAPCTGLSLYNNDIATVGEDGRLNIVSSGQSLSVHRTIQADSCSLTTCHYASPQEVLTGSRMGIIRMFDIRAAADDKQVMSFMSSCDDDKRCNYVSSMTSYPTQPHIILAGCEEGSITVFDLRNPGVPAAYYMAHKGPITELGFHPNDPNKLFTASEVGELWLWRQNSSISVDDKVESSNIWLNGDRCRSHTEIKSVLDKLNQPANSFDIRGDRIICGTDAEAVHYVDALL